MLVVGAREQEAEQIAVRTRTGEDRGAQAVESFAELVLELTGNRSRDL